MGIKDSNNLISSYVKPIRDNLPQGGEWEGGKEGMMDE